MRYLLIALTLLISTTAWAKVELFTAAKPAIDANDVAVSMVNNGQFKECEEMGIIHSKNFSDSQTKKGMFKRMRKQAANVGATNIFIKTSDKGEAMGSVFYCPKSK